MEERKEIAQQLIEAAKEKLKSAKILFDHGMYRDAVSRAYYAVFLAAKAVLFMLGESPKSHEGVIYLFWSRLINPGHVDKKLGKILAKLRNSREESDYGPFFTIDKEDAKWAIDNATIFFETISKLIDKIIKQTNEFNKMENDYGLP